MGRCLRRLCGGSQRVDLVWNAVWKSWPAWFWTTFDGSGHLPSGSEPRPCKLGKATSRAWIYGCEEYGRGRDHLVTRSSGFRIRARGDRLF
jgi:hypothetical protein